MTDDYEEIITELLSQLTAQEILLLIILIEEGGVVFGNTQVERED